MNMKFIRVFVFLLSFIQFTRSRNKCYPCNCATMQLPGEYRQDRVRWRTTNTFYTLYCHKRDEVTYDVPHQAENWTPAILMYYQPIARNGGLKKSHFERFTHLTILSCVLNTATYVERDFLYPHRATLKELAIVWNNFPFIPVGLVQNAPLLEMVDFKGNGMKIIYKGTYTNLDYLKWICLQKNHIETIEIGALRNLPALEFVEFDGNLLTFVDIGAFDIKSSVLLATYTLFNNNPWFCDMKLCPFMHRSKANEIKCKEPRHLQGRTFAFAIDYIGIIPDQVRYIVDEFDNSVTMKCSTCSFKKLEWEKRGTEAVGKGGLPGGCKILQADGSQTSQLVIAQPKYEHNGNYSCYNPDCTTTNCPIPVIALIIRIAEPKWNFTGHEASLDEVVRYGSTGWFYILLPILIYSIVMAVAMSAYYIYIQIKRNAPQQQP